MGITRVMMKSSIPVKAKKQKKRKSYSLLFLALPFVLWQFVFKYIPLAGWSLAFFNYRLGFKLSELPFAGLKYFGLIIDDLPYIKDILVNTLAMSGLMMLNAPAAIFLAIMLNEVKAGKVKSLVQTITTLPHFVSMVIVYALFYAIFSHSGAMNEILTTVGLVKEPLNVLGNPKIAWYFQLFISLWKECGWSAIIYLSAIAGIDQELYDAVEIDGGGRFNRIWHITIPGIMPTFVVLLLLRVSNILNNGALWEQVFVFMNPMVQEKLEILNYYIYRMGILTGDYSYSTAMGIVNSFISLILLFGTNALAKKIRGNTII